MTPAQEIELGFWRRCFVEEEGGDAEKYLARRERNFREDAKSFWDAIFTEKGLGLDLGCGLVSTLGFKGTPIVATDPLLPEYDNIFRHRFAHAIYEADSGEELNFGGEFDYVWCINVIDHTPRPERMVAEITRVLKPGGRLYFSVNFDQELQNEAHFTLWSLEKVERELVGLRQFHLLTGIKQWRPEYRKYTFSGLYERV
jgi:2-polyprenyl-3-methyl-5-hydroxy-6-metoxy-1,4-benzoquinol methylase